MRLLLDAGADTEAKNHVRRDGSPRLQFGVLVGFWWPVSDGGAEFGHMLIHSCNLHFLFGDVAVRICDFCL